MQTSFVFNQRKWPGAGDLDDCWVLSAIQCAHAVAPWLRLPSVPVFREAAGDPDDGVTDGGNLTEIVRGVETLWPRYFEGNLAKLQGSPWAVVIDLLAEGHPISFATISAKLPTRVQFGFGGYHQISVVRKPDGRVLVANPLAPVYSRWTEVNLAELKPAVMAYGRDKAGTSGAWGVVFPTDAEMADLYWGQEDTTPYDQEDIDLATAELRERIDEARDVLDGVQ